MFVVVLYEKLPTFCYLYGMVGHGSIHYSRQSSVDINCSLSPSLKVPSGPIGLETGAIMDSTNEGLEVMIDSSSPTEEGHIDENIELSFGPWIFVSRQRGERWWPWGHRRWCWMSSIRCGVCGHYRSISFYSQYTAVSWFEYLAMWRLLLV